MVKWDEIVFPDTDTLRTLEDAKKNLFCILKYPFIYFTISFYNSPNILVSIFTYNSSK